MGYARTLPFSVVEQSSQLKSTVTVTTVATDYTVNVIPVPHFDAPPYRAYIDVMVQTVADTSGAINSMQTGSYGIVDAGSTYHSGGSMTSGALYTVANEVWHGHYVLPGYLDIAPYLTSDTNQMVTLHGVSCIGDNLILRGLYGRLRMMFV